MPSTLMFKITDAGLLNAANALAQGIRVRITEFKLGSGFGYVPNGNEVGLAGTTLYAESVTSYRNMPDGSLVIVCSVDVQAGPFEFGEVGLYTDTGLLFAVATLPQRQTKYSSLDSNINSTFTFNCHLRLAQSTGIFEVATISIPPYEAYARWHEIKPPLQMPDPRITQITVTDIDNHRDVTTLTQTPDGNWSIQSNLICAGPSTAIIASTLTYVEVSAAVWQNAFPGSVAATLAAVANTTLVLQMSGSRFRKVVATASGANVRLTFQGANLTTALALTQTVSIWCNNNPRAVGVRAINGNYIIASGNGTVGSPLRFDIDLAALVAAIGTPTPVGSPVGTPVGKVGSPVGSPVG